MNSLGRNSLIYCLAAALLTRIGWVAYGIYRVGNNYNITPYEDWYNDSYGYFRIARNLAFNHVFSYAQAEPYLPTAFRPPLYPFLISVLWWAEPAPLIAVLAVQVILGVLTVWLTYLLGRDTFSRSVGFVAAGLLAVAPMTGYYTGQLMTETLFTFLMVLAAYLWSRHWIVVAGATLGLAWLTRATALPFILALLVAGVFKRPVLKIAVIALLVGGAWTIRNAIVFNRFIPVATAGTGTNLYFGTLDLPTFRGDGQHWKEVWLDPLIVNTSYSMDTEARDRLLRDAAITKIKSTPSRWLSARAHQMPRLLMDDMSYLSFRHYQVPSVIVWGFRAFCMLMCGLSIYAMWLYRARLSELLYLWLFPVTLIASHLPMWTEARYSLPIIPFVLILGAATYLQRSNST